MAVDVSILISVAPPAARLGEVLDALECHLPPSIQPVRSERIVVLRRPTPEMRAWIAARPEPLVVLTSTDELGIAGSFNLARSRAQGRYLALLHDDSRIEPGWLEGLLAVSANYPEAGVLSSLSLDRDGSLQSAGSLLWREGWTTVPWPPDAPASLDSFGPVEPIDYAGTCAAFVRAEIFDAMGGLNEELHPGFYVGVDLHLAVRRLGYVSLLVPDSRIVHGGDGHVAPALRAFLSQRNRGLFARKWQHEISLRPTFDPTADGCAAARERVRLEAVALADAFRRAPPALESRFRFDPEEQRRRLRRCNEELALGFQIWRASPEGNR